MRWSFASDVQRASGFPLPSGEPGLTRCFYQPRHEHAKGFGTPGTGYGFAMEEVLPGVFHWTAEHPKIHIPVSSYWLDEGGVAVDPLVPPEGGLEWFARRPTPPAAILLSNRHHYRDSGRFAAAFGCGVLCNEAGLHEFGDDRAVTGFAVGDVLPGGAVACGVGGICPDDTAFHLPGQRALLFADAVVRAGDGPLGFVPDYLMDDPPGTKQALLAVLARLLDTIDFDHVLLAHGDPVIGDGRLKLQELVDSGGRTAF